MKRRFLIDTHDLRGAIAHITAPEAGRRVVITAFVGADALSFIPKPSGVEIYCWDQPSATDPEGVADLMEDAEVWFVNGLHAKVYWSEHHGVLVGSQNLSSAALSESASLIESAIYYDDSDAVDIERLLRRINPKRRKAGDWLDDLRSRSNRDPIARRGKISRLRSLNEYFALSHPAEWRIEFWKSEGYHGKSDYAALIGTEGIEDTNDARSSILRSIPTSSTTREGDWILAVHWTPSGRAGGPLEWISVDRIARVYGDDRAYHLRGAHRPPPFNCREPGFLGALKRYVTEHVDPSANGRRMTLKQIRILAKEFSKIS